MEQHLIHRAVDLLTSDAISRSYRRRFNCDNERDIASLVSDLRLCVLNASPFENRWWRFTANQGTGFTDEMRMHIAWDISPSPRWNLELSRSNSASRWQRINLPSKTNLTSKLFANHNALGQLTNHNTFCFSEGRPSSNPELIEPFVWGWGERYCNNVNYVKNNVIFEPPSMRACSSTPPKQNQDFVKEHNRTPLNFSRLVTAKIIIIIIIQSHYYMQ